MPYRLTLPARINLLGNPGDAAEGDFATLSMAVDLYAGAVIGPANRMIFDIYASPDAHDGGQAPVERAIFAPGEFPLPYDGQANLLKSALNILYTYSPEFRGKYASQGMQLSTWSQVPRQSGLGGSTLFVLLTLAGLREAYALEHKTHHDYVLAELAQRAEAQELKITCGYADRYIPLFGGLAYIDYRGKLEQNPIRHEPFATVERLDGWIDDLPLVAISTGLKRDSGDVHGQMRPRYLDEHRRWAREGGTPPPLVEIMSAVWKTAWQGKIALLEGDLPTLGSLMNENHRLVNQMMSACGFSGGAGPINNLLIRTALENGALGAKLTGAGSGGSVFALVRRGQEEKVTSAWRGEARKAGLDSAQVFTPHMDKTGLRIDGGAGLVPARQIK